MASGEPQGALLALFNDLAEQCRQALLDALQIGGMSDSVERGPLLFVIVCLSLLTLSASLSVADTTGNAYLTGMALGVGVCLAARLVWDSLNQSDGQLCQTRLKSQTAPSQDSRPHVWTKVGKDGRQSSQLIVFSNGTRVFEHAVNSGENSALGEQFAGMFEEKPDVTTIYSADGLKIRTYPDGVRTISRRFSGGTYFRKWEGYDKYDSIELRTTAGISVELFAHGAKTIDFPHGCLYEDLVDGRRRTYSVDYVLEREEPLDKSVIANNIRMFETLDKLLLAGSADILDSTIFLQLLCVQLHTENTGPEKSAVEKIVQEIEL